MTFSTLYVFKYLVHADMHETTGTSLLSLGFYSQVLVRKCFPTFSLHFPLLTLILKLLVIVLSGPLNNTFFPPLYLGLALRD